MFSSIVTTLNMAWPYRGSENGRISQDHSNIVNFVTFAEITSVSVPLMTE